MSIPSHPKPLSTVSSQGRSPSYENKRPPFQRNHNSHNNKGPRKNERIRANEVRLIGPDGSQIGVVAIKDALLLAKKHEMDLVEISPTARPPVCRIIDFGKYMYEESKKQKTAKKNVIKLKEIKFRPGIDIHDYRTKMSHAEEFLSDGNKVKFTLSLKGREIENSHIGFDLLRRAIEDLKEFGTPDAPPKMAGRNITLTMSPAPNSKRKLKPTAPLPSQKFSTSGPALSNPFEKI